MPEGGARVGAYEDVLKTNCETHTRAYVCKGRLSCKQQQRHRGRSQEETPPLVAAHDVRIHIGDCGLRFTSLSHIPHPLPTFTLSFTLASAPTQQHTNAHSLLHTPTLHQTTRCQCPNESVACVSIPEESFFPAVLSADSFFPPILSLRDSIQARLLCRPRRRLRLRRGSRDGLSFRLLLVFFCWRQRQRRPPRRSARPELAQKAQRGAVPTSGRSLPPRSFVALAARRRRRGGGAGPNNPGNAEEAQRNSRLAHYRTAQATIVTAVHHIAGRLSSSSSGGGWAGGQAGRLALFFVFVVVRENAMYSRRTHALCSLCECKSPLMRQYCVPVRRSCVFGLNLVGGWAFAGASESRVAGASRLKPPPRRPARRAMFQPTIASLSTRSVYWQRTTQPTTTVPTTAPTPR